MNSNWSNRTGTIFLRRFLKAFVGKATAKPSAGPEVANILRPAMPFYAVGDLHGRVDLLETLIARIDPAADERIIFLGDYIDRGDQSAQTLDRVFQMMQERPNQVICLMGNHEKMMCDFIDDPLDRGAIWLRNGGLATLGSYGITGASANPTPDQAIDISTALEAALPAGVLKWVRELPLSWSSGNIWCVHAAMDPSSAPQAQHAKTLLWGHRDFLETPRDDGICVVHGHTIVDEPVNMNSRISIDTGAYRSGRLTAAHIAEGKCKFIAA
jgi:serine/threonine protein phosphatase 1